MVYFKQIQYTEVMNPYFILLSPHENSTEKPFRVKGWKVQPDLWPLNRLEAFPIRSQKNIILYQMAVILNETVMAYHDRSAAGGNKEIKDIFTVKFTSG